MIAENPNPIKLCPVTPSDVDISLLFSLLEQRQFGISHAKMPSFARHQDFVKNNTYRAWFFVENEQELIGNMYVLNTNYIGINMLEGYASYIEAAIDKLVQLLRPLPPIASIRPAQFLINVAPQDALQIQALEMAGGVLIQKTYTCPDQSNVK